MLVESSFAGLEAARKHGPMFLIILSRQEGRAFWRIINIPNDVGASLEPVIEHAQARIRDEVGETHSDGGRFLLLEERGIMGVPRA